MAPVAAPKWHGRSKMVKANILKAASSSSAISQSWSDGKSMAGVKLIPRVKDIIDQYWRKLITVADKNKEKPHLSKDQFFKYTPEKGFVLDAEQLSKNRFVDVSQNVDRSMSHVAGMRTTTSNSEYYSYQLDRAVLAKEHFRVLMHSKLNFGDLADGPIRDLAGHSLSMPNAALLATAMLLGSKFSGLWEFEPAASSYS